MSAGHAGSVSRMTGRGCPVKAPVENHPSAINLRRGRTAWQDRAGYDGHASSHSARAAGLAGAARIHHDVPPFVKVADDDQIRALNVTGLRRAGFPEADIEALDEAARRLFVTRKKPFAVVMAEFDTENGINPHVKKMIDFLRQRDAGKHGRYLESKRAK